ncbi:transglutaminase-like cysteine peptidase [Roseospira visakhapatnamensis]|uniref:Putative transglutaminase-like cysteine proteinase n=1 Tax=Roseospira visakhapatnamensis TaxID=390880 RepID=A0A7W6W8W5_9PROT|nr:transglutaminase-like cysteine peptidase [Roseospira visakhapatnamensis]MBB4264812.1 putative transglutaminase-like cysteine proteinase [Roseospira visakhapatnamensis]
MHRTRWTSALRGTATATLGRPGLARVTGVLLAMTLACGAPAALADDDRLFGRDGKAYTDFAPMPQWTTMLERLKAEERENSACGAGAPIDGCPHTEWSALIARIRDREPRAQIEAVQDFVNQWEYITDPINWGREDFWTTPSEFFVKAGDCEDYAIAKFMSLRALGFPGDALKVVAVRDLNLGIGHAVTVVTLAGETLLLDNQIDPVIETRSVRHYRPVFAASEDVWWLYR